MKQFIKNPFERTQKCMVLVYALCLLACVANAQTEKKPVWDFPGKEERASLKNRKEMMEAYQIPQEVLNTLSTKDLAEICFNYPLYFEFTAFNDERKGISLMIERFNGLKELSNRKDGARELINIYQTLPVFDENRQIIPDKQYPMLLKFDYLELLLSDDAFAKQMDEQTATALGKIVLDKYEGKLEHIHAYGIHGIRNSFLLGAIVLEKSSRSAEQQAAVKQFINNYRHANPDMLTEISKIISGL